MRVISFALLTLVLTLVYASRLILSASAEDKKQLQDLKDHFLSIPAVPKVELPTSHDQQEECEVEESEEMSPQDQLDMELKQLIKHREKNHSPLEIETRELIQQLVLIGGASIRTRYLIRASRQNDLELFSTLINLTKPKVVRTFARKKYGEELFKVLGKTPGDNIYLPKIVIHLLDCGVKIEDRRLLSIFVQSPELADQLGKHKLDFDFDLALKLCASGHKLVYPDAFESFLPYCCPCQALTWIVRNHQLILQPKQAVRIIVSLVPKYLSSGNIKRYELGYYGIVRVCSMMSRLDLAVYLLIKGAPPIKFHPFHRVSCTIEQTFLFFQEQIFPKIILLINVDSRDQEYGEFTVFPREIVQLVLMLLFKHFTSLTETEQHQTSFSLFNDLLSSTARP